MNVIICDDDSCYREALRNTIHSWALLHQLRNTIIVRCFDSSEEIFNACKNGLTIDIAFLDIQIPGEMNGLELAKSIRSTNEQASIVFVTNYSEYACDGYSVNALRYLQKPICDSMVYECLDIAYRQWEFAKEQFIYVNINKKKIVLPFQYILYIEASAHRLRIHRVGKETLEVRSYIKDIIEKLPDEMFVRCHRSYIVNILYARSISKRHIVMAGDYTVPIGEKYMSNALERFKQYYQGVTL